MKNIILVLFIIPITSFSIREVVKTYYPNGQLLSEISYKEGRRDGPCKLYWDSNYFWEKSKIKAEMHYKEGKQAGLYTSYYENGQIEHQGSYKYNELGVYSRQNGEWNTYYENGELRMHSILKDGLQLEWKSYKKDGKLLQRGETVLIDGVPVNQIVYDSKGKLLPVNGGC